MIMSDEDNFIAKSDKNIRKVPKKPHYFAKSVENNKTIPRRHAKQV